MKLEEIDFSKMSNEELAEFAKIRFRCLHKERDNGRCGNCNGYNNNCYDMTTASHLESFYKLFEWTSNDSVEEM